MAYIIQPYFLFTIAYVFAKTSTYSWINAFIITGAKLAFGKFILQEKYKNVVDQFWNTFLKEVFKIQMATITGSLIVLNTYLGHKVPVYV